MTFSGHWLESDRTGYFDITLQMILQCASLLFQGLLPYTWCPEAGLVMGCSHDPQSPDFSVL
jgi:hypothetical protein